MQLLSRVAENLFWLGRYVERAENTARLLDVTYHGRLEPSSSEVVGATNTWEALIATLGLEAGYRQRGYTATETGVIEYLTVDRGNPSSIVAAVVQARENAASVRDYLSSETWVAINRLYHSIASSNIYLILADGLYDFCDSVRLGSHLFSGTADATSLHDEGWHWMRAGIYLERADMVTRIVDSKYHLLMTSPEEVGSPVDRFQWVAVLRSVSGWEAYRRSHDEVEPSGVAEFLLLNEAFPRSLRSAIDSLATCLESATSGADRKLRNPPMRRISDMQSRLEFGTAETLILHGLHEFVSDIQGSLACLTTEVSSAFFWPGGP